MRPRVIPVLLLDSRCRLVKTRGFRDEVYIGDPFNVVRIFNEKEVDEICVLDIDATVQGRKPDVGFIRELASECFMPLSYGGGVRSVADAAPIYAAGVEKVVLGRAGSDDRIIRGIADSFGSQAVTVCIDYRRVNTDLRVVTDRGRVVTDSDPVTRARRAEAVGAGEILLHNVDRDGTRAGYDLDMISEVAQAIQVPLVALGGAGSVRHLAEGLAAGASAVASGSSFVFLGRLRAVLLTYPAGHEMDRMRASLRGEV
ncbi:HisA/HisF-related TIM barrel protein [Bradyrhizobium yuanmingense]|uniref:HisA/HisF-related TIM barrel protein n=1 Tax=Bradyrhizobium yuanmingense TaxID=108015 RepID=UPI0023BA23DD|nr:HisA/HisF-related TIM barrel protein [Bradyrhizobium yuanmingense]MDF0583806.1 HisA/HisF-related TIM barrel protein [Bradyrhizobium yuanmingense]